jgi:hypothetical protein
MHATSTHKLQYRYRWVSLSALLGAILFVPAPSSAADSIVDAVRDWSAIASNVITAPPPMANRGGGAAAVDFAYVHAAIYDAAIACWESKYKYNFWRPVTAIRHGDIDGNDATAPDPSWTPLAPTPTHPEYPSAHGCLTAAIAYSIEQYFGTKKITTNFTAFSVPGYPNGLTYTFDRTQDILKQVIEGRIFGGMHYRTSVVHGIVVGHKVSQLVSKHYFLPVDDEHGRGKGHSKKP